jgi:hypothetical protein
MTAKDVRDIRRHNLRVLCEQWSVNGVAKKCKWEYPSYVSAMISPLKSRPITETTARRIEKYLELPAMWMDTEHDLPATPAQVDVKMVMSIMELVRKECEAIGVTPSVSTQQRLVELIYDEAQKAGRLDEAFVNRVVGLLKH